jgi:hypothetical protein
MRKNIGDQCPSCGFRMSDLLAGATSRADELLREMLRRYEHSGVGAAVTHLLATQVSTPDSSNVMIALVELAREQRHKPGVKALLKAMNERLTQ